MKISSSMTDDAVLRELGARLEGARLAANLTQAQLASQAGVSKRTVERLEAGVVAAQLSVLLRVCRVLGLLERLELLVPESGPSPVAQLKLKRRARQRASGRRAARAPAWTWDKP